MERDKLQRKRRPLSFEAGFEIFGSDAAENDPRLKDYFFETNTYKKVSTGNTQFVLGRKGSGKSAIFKMLAEKSKENTVVVPITPRLFALDVLNDFIKKYPETPFNKEVAYVTAWRYSLMIELLLAIEDTSGKLKIGGEAGVHEWLRKNVELNSDIITRTVAFLEKWTIEKVSLSQLSAQLGMKSKRGPLIGHDIDEILPEIDKVLNTKKFILAIDNLDEGWLDKEDSRSYLVGLILASIELSRLNNLKVVVFLRTDMFEVLEASYQHMDKFREAVEYITWNATSLSRIISLRIQRYYNIKNESNLYSWKRLFPTKMENNFPTHKHITERTFLRPREIIQFCRLSVEVASKRKHSTVEQSDIRLAEDKYAEWKLNDLSGEYSAYYRNVDHFLNCFRLERASFSRWQLERQIEEAIKHSNFHPIDCDNIKLQTGNIVNLLYKMGFIRARCQNEEGKWIYISSSSDPNIVCSIIDKWDMHPAFRKKLIIQKTKHKYSSRDK